MYPAFKHEFLHSVSAVEGGPKRATASTGSLFAHAGSVPALLPSQRAAAGANKAGGGGGGGGGGLGGGGAGAARAAAAASKSPAKQAQPGAHGDGAAPLPRRHMTVRTNQRSRYSLGTTHHGSEAFMEHDDDSDGDDEGQAGDAPSLVAAYSASNVMALAAASSPHSSVRSPSWQGISSAGRRDSNEWGAAADAASTVPAAVLADVPRSHSQLTASNVTNLFVLLQASQHEV